MNTKKIAAIVVTYNRKELLIQCLNHILQQTFKPAAIYIIDNASTDGTDLLLREKKFCSSNSDGKVVLNDVNIIYLKLSENSGGAGGFYMGMKTANETGIYDALWVMDDDGVPEKNCLYYLASNLPDFDYIASTVLSIEDRNSLAFPYKGKILGYSEFKEYAKDNLVKKFACPMNGILYSRKLLDIVGYPIPNLFIWGDEQNLNLRCISAGFEPITDIRAIHYHPKCKDVYKKSMFDRRIVFVPQLWKGYCQYRNFIYNYHGRMALKSLVYYYFLHMYYFVFKIHSWKWVKCFNDAYFSGFKKQVDDDYKKYMS